jgi:hypothetical protein
VQAYERNGGCGAAQQTALLATALCWCVLLNHSWRAMLLKLGLRQDAAGGAGVAGGTDGGALELWDLRYPSSPAAVVPVAATLRAASDIDLFPAAGTLARSW